MLVNCTAYEGGLKIADMPLDQVGEHLARPGRFVWVALKDPTDQELEALQPVFNIHDLAMEDALRGHERPKLDEFGEHIFAVMHLLEMREGDVEIGEVAIFIGPNYALTVRRRAEQTFHNIRQRSEEEPELLAQGPVFVLYALMDTVVERYFPILDALETELEDIEARMFSGKARRNTIEGLYDLKRKATILRHAVVPLREAVGRLHGGRVPRLCVNMQEYFRDVDDHATRILASVEDLKEGISTAIQVNLSLVAFEAGEVNKRLTAYAAIFAVATVFTGLWGMNFKMMPELEWEYGYPMALTVIATLTAVMFYRFRKAGWV